MTNDVQDRPIDLAGRRDRGASSASPSTPRFAGRVFDGGSMASGADRYFLVHPVAIDGPEAEGAGGSLVADSARAVTVLVIGARPVAVGDVLICHPVGGRWVAEPKSGTPNLPSCNPKVPACANAAYSANGTVADPYSGTVPLAYDYPLGLWYSPWLPFWIDAAHRGWYFYTLGPTAGTVVDATLRVIIRDTGPLAGSYQPYPGPGGSIAYPDVFGYPGGSGIATRYHHSTGAPTSCDPLIHDASFVVDGSATDYHPPTSARFAVPKSIPSGVGYECDTPCPLPLKDLHVSWTTADGSGSGTLACDTSTSPPRWRMCRDGLEVVLARGGGIGAAETYLTVKTHDAGDCSGPFTALGSSAPGQTMALIPLWPGVSGNFTCEPLYLPYVVYVTHGAGSLWDAGFRKFIVTE